MKNEIAEAIIKRRTKRVRQLTAEVYQLEEEIRKDPAGNHLEERYLRAIQEREQIVELLFLDYLLDDGVIHSDTFEIKQSEIFNKKGPRIVHKDADIW